jgi:hypothetical protein
MPAGIEHPVLGYLSFVGVKFVGYSMAARAISWSYGRSDLNSFMVGGARTLIGMATGAAYFGLTAAAASWGLGPLARGPSTVRGELFYLAGLLPLRIAEWWLLLWIFYDRQFREVWKDWRTVGLAIAWSYVLDAPAILGFLAVGKFWVC